MTARRGLQDPLLHLRRPHQAQHHPLQPAADKHDVARLALPQRLLPLLADGLHAAGTLLDLLPMQPAGGHVGQGVLRQAGDDADVLEHGRYL